MSRAEQRRALPQEILVGGTGYSISSIHNRFLLSPYAEMMRGRVRWGDFLLNDPVTHIRILGRDADNLYHEDLSLRTGDAFIEYSIHPPKCWGNRPIPEFMTSRDFQRKLRFLWDEHDDAEATKGDIANPGKNKKSETLENVELLRIQCELHKDDLGSFGKFVEATIEKNTRMYITLDTPSFEEFIQMYRKAWTELGGKNELFGVIFQILDEGMFRDDTQLAKTFAISERSLYLRTALNSWGLQQERRNQLIDDTIADKMQALARGVLTNGFPKLIEAAEIYPPVFLQLIANAKTIREIFSADEQKVAAQLFKYQQYKTQEEYAVLFLENREKWRVFESIYEHQIQTYDPRDP